MGLFRKIKHLIWGVSLEEACSYRHTLNQLNKHMECLNLLIMEQRGHENRFSLAMYMDEIKVTTQHIHAIERILADSQYDNILK